MKLLRIGAPGAEKPAILDAEGVARDLGGIVDDISGEALTPEGLARLRALDPFDLPALEGRIGPCVGVVGKIVCVGLNYVKHAAEAGLDVPEEPVLFMKAVSAISGPDDDILIPRGAEKTDWEVELAAVIGAPGVDIDEADALDHVAGYCVLNDVSERAHQLERGGQWVKGKSADSFAPLGPWLVTADEIPDPQALGLWTEVDGVRRQDSSTSDMVFGVRRLVSYISRFMSLRSGDVIATGTPSGVGAGFSPPVFLKGGETVRLGVDGLGVQAHRARRV